MIIVNRQLVWDFVNCGKSYQVFYE